MNIALIGHGKMGKTIEEIAISRGHKIVCIIDVDNLDDFASDAFRSADVAIEFTTPATAVDNYRRAFAASVPVVSGTTGWLSREQEVRKLVADSDASFFYTSNFSIGVNIFFALNRYLAKIMNGFSQYDVAMHEIHHIHKLDHPSGTAISLAGGITDCLDRKSGWTENPDETDKLLITNERIGEVPGTHIVTYTSDVDAIKIEHEAFSRRGFALGAVLAAEWLPGHKGWCSMNDMLNFLND
ncbi:MAG: 4-hydroxy-tetrahydrodipicolinate reductase [Bacteroidales bacterium]|nr:4-hydroxy-tetrahydrodipicolinate reductase [Bacteroidales bacterium]